MLDQGPEDIFVRFKSMPVSLSRSFMTSAASLISNRNADPDFSILVCFGFESPNKLKFSYGAGALKFHVIHPLCVSMNTRYR